MIPRLKWPVSPGRKRHASPFDRGDNSPLSFTLHTPSSELEPAAATEVLRELGCLDEFRAADTSASLLPHLTVTRERRGQALMEYFPVEVVHETGRQSAGIHGPERWLRQGHTADQEDHLLVAAASDALHHDVLVTTSAFLLQEAGAGRLGQLNVIGPTEAVKLIGLFLRARDVFVYEAPKGWRLQIDRGGFYHVLSRQRLPALWRYTSACALADKPRGDDSVLLSSSILVRARRILEQRDAIAVEFYKRQSNNTRDAMMSHLDYWSLLVMGVLDAMARISHRTYQLPRAERYVSFRRTGVSATIRRHGGAALADAIDAPHVAAFIDLVGSLRNMVHGASFVPVGVVRGRDEDDQSSRVRVPDADGSAVVSAATRLVPLDSIGIEQSYGILVEPHTFVTRMTDLFHQIVNQLAAATDVERLFPAGAPIPELGTGPAVDRHWDQNQAGRIDLLG